MSIPSRAINETDLLALVQWMSPAFPLGSFAYSHGLEQAIEDGAVSDAASLGRWLDALLAYGSIRNEAVLVSLAHRKILPDSELAAMAESLSAGAERWTETHDQGRAFVETTEALLGDEIPNMPLPIALGVRCRALAVPLKSVLILYLHALVGNLVSIATRTIPLGQSEAQICLAERAEAIAQTADVCSDANVGDLGSASLAVDIASMRHEVLEVRHFRT